MSAFARQCIVCGAADARLLPFPAGMRDGVCAQLSCQHVIQRQFVAHRAASEQRRRDAIRVAIGGADPIAILPANRSRTSRLPAHRRAAFLAFLETRLAESLAASDTALSQAAVPNAYETLAPRERQAVSVACATCRGSCCQTGGTTAWLSAETLCRVRGESGLDTAALRDVYLRDLPTRSYEGSCVYHTARGCALSPPLRSDTCHRYLCDGAEALVTLVRSTTVRAAHAVATEGHQVIRTQRVVLRDDVSESRASSA